jgi:SAM-dependent methyltransferase
MYTQQARIQDAPAVPATPAATAEPPSSLPEDYLARLNMQQGRDVWRGNHPKIDFILRRAARYLQAGCKVCDVGIGDGYLLDRLEDLGLECVGVDISDYLVRFHRRRLAEGGRKTQVICSNIADLRKGGSGFRAVFCLDLLEHLSAADYQQALVNIHVMLRPGGVLVGSVPYRENLQSSMVCCPACGHVFHRVGHQQSFDSQKLAETLAPWFDLRAFGLVRTASPKNLRQAVSHALLLPLRKLRHWYHSRWDPVGELRPGDTCYFIAAKRRAAGEPARATSGSRPGPLSNESEPAR